MTTSVTNNKAVMKMAHTFTTEGFLSLKTAAVGSGTGNNLLDLFNLNLSRG